MIIKLTYGHETVIDEADSDLALLKWSTRRSYNKFYAYRATGVHMHRIILSRVLGRELLPSELVDHEDGNGLNNRRDNLRLASHAQNARNRQMHKNNTSGYKGVYKNGKRFIARLTVNGRLTSVGTYDTSELAALAYNAAAILHHGEFARLNEFT